MDSKDSNKEKYNTEKYNIIMPESDDRTLCLRIEKLMSADGYHGNFIPRADAIIAAHGELRLLVHFKSYKGWDSEAARSSFGDTAIYGPKVIKFAMVNPPPTEMLRYKVQTPLFRGEIKIFSEEELAAALAWVKS